MGSKEKRKRVKKEYVEVESTFYLRLPASCAPYAEKAMKELQSFFANELANSDGVDEILIGDQFEGDKDVPEEVWEDMADWSTSWSRKSKITKFKA